mmetsp:Transcript_30938/g.69708  ORF Transcript_30938/g.69708 Transcript_30938/m.69708 type:complete len:231 (+) Transcript_30938:448-1140(+)
MSSLEERDRECGRQPSVMPTRNTTSNSSPLLACTVINFMRGSFFTSISSLISSWNSSSSPATSATSSRKEWRPSRPITSVRCEAFFNSWMFAQRSSYFSSFCRYTSYSVTSMSVSIISSGLHSFAASQRVFMTFQNCRRLFFCRDVKTSSSADRTRFCAALALLLLSFSSSDSREDSIESSRSIAWKVEIPFFAAYSTTVSIVLEPIPLGGRLMIRASDAESLGLAITRR